MIGVAYVLIPERLYENLVDGSNQLAFEGVFNVGIFQEDFLICIKFKSDASYLGGSGSVWNLRLSSWVWGGTKIVVAIVLYISGFKVSHRCPNAPQPRFELMEAAFAFNLFGSPLDEGQTGLRFGVFSTGRYAYAVLGSICR